MLFIHLVGDTVAFPLVGGLSDQFGLDRAVLLLPAVVAFGVTAVVAQSDPIAARKALMKEVGAQTKTGGAMAKAVVPLDRFIERPAVPGDVERRRCVE